MYHTAIPYRVKQGGCRETPVLKTGSLQYEQNLCNESSNGCHFVNLLSFASRSFFLSLRKITWLNCIHSKTRGHVEYIPISSYFLIKPQKIAKISQLLLRLLSKHQSFVAFLGTMHFTNPQIVRQSTFVPSCPKLWPFWAQNPKYFLKKGSLQH